jgi:hypothetical protein
MKKWLFNPFIYIAGTRSLVLGWAALTITAVIAYFSHTSFDGVIDIHPLPALLAMHFAEQFITWGSLVAVFYVAGRIWSRLAIRFIDIAGTLALARWVLILAAIAGFGMDAGVVAKMNTLPHQEMVKLIGPSFIITSFLQVIALVWMVALLYNAFSLCCNLKGGKATGIFVGALVIAEILSKIILHVVHSKIASV